MTGLTGWFTLRIAAVNRAFRSYSHPFDIAAARADDPEWTIRVAPGTPEPAIAGLVDALTAQGRPVRRNGLTLTVGKLHRPPVTAGQFLIDVTPIGHPPGTEFIPGGDAPR